MNLKARAIVGLLETEPVNVTLDGDIVWITMRYPGGMEAVLKVHPSEIEWRTPSQFVGCHIEESGGTAE